MGCEKVGSGPFAGNQGQNPCAGLSVNGQAGGVPGLNINVNTNQNMGFPIGPVLGAISGGLTAEKIRQAEAGKVFTPPKTILGKAIGKVSGRTAAAQVSEAQKMAVSSAPMDMATQKNLARQGFPVSGGLSFGQAKQGETLKILGILGVVVLGIFYFNKPKRRGRRR